METLGDHHLPGRRAERLVAAVVERDADWTDQDRLEALAWQQVDGGRCGGCRGHLAETTHPDNEDAYEGHIIRCHRCRARDHAAREFTAGEGASSAGLMTYTTSDPSVTST